MTSITLARRASLTSGFRGLNRSNLSAGMMVLLVYLFAGLPIQIGVLTQMGLSSNESASWFFITWLTTGLFSFVLALVTRQPVSINLSIPALIFLAGAAGGFTLPQIIGANLVVGLVAVGLSVFRVADAFARRVPSQVAIGVFAGSMLLFMLKTSQMAVSDPMIVGPVLASFVVTLALTRNQLLAVAVAAAAGLVGVAAADGVPTTLNSAQLPQVLPMDISFDPSAVIALGIPLLILVVGVGNIQALAVVRSEGFRVKGNMLGLTAGVATLVNSLGGGHAASIGGAATPIGAGSGAGPSKHRFWAVVISSAPVVAIAFAAVPITAIVQELPVTYTLTVGALALVAPFKQVLTKTLESPKRISALTAVAVAAIPLQMAGMPMAFWALVAGILVATLESRDFVRYLRLSRRTAISS